MQGRLCFILVVIEPVTGRCMSHRIARPSDDAGSGLEAFHALAEIRQRLNPLPVFGVAREQGDDAPCLGLGCLGADNKVIVTACKLVDLGGLGAPRA